MSDRLLDMEDPHRFYLPRRQSTMNLWRAFKRISLATADGLWCKAVRRLLHEGTCHQIAEEMIREYGLER